MKPQFRPRPMTALPLLVAVVVLSGCGPWEATPEGPSVAFVVYDAGETLGLLPVASRVRGRGVEVRWIPLTPWSADLLEANGEEYLNLPDRIQDMAHLGARDAETDIAYWVQALAAEPPELAVSGLVSTAQIQLGQWFQSAGIRSRGFHDGFQPPSPGSIVVQAASVFEELWVPTTRVRDRFMAMGVPAVLAGQPTLEDWRRTSVEIDAAEVRRAVGVREDDRVLLFAGQYGPGYGEILNSFLEAVGLILSADSSLHLVITHHPRTDGEVEREALARSGLRRATMAPEGMPTMEVAVVAEMVLTWTSTVGVQATFMGKPVVYYSPPPDFDAHLVEEGVASMVDAESLSSTVAAMLEAGRTPDSIRRILVDSGYVVDADSVVADLVRETLRLDGA